MMDLRNAPQTAEKPITQPAILHDFGFVSAFCIPALVLALLAGFLWSVPPAASQQSAAIPEAGEIVRDCPECAELVVIPTGEFEMGANDAPYEKPVHKVTIAKPFAIGRREVTFDEWDACVSAGGCKHSPDDRG